MKKFYIFEISLITIFLLSCSRADKTVIDNNITSIPAMDKQENDVIPTQAKDKNAISYNVESCDKSDNINDYSITDIEFSENDVSIKYPQVIGLNDIIKQESINELLKKEAMDGYALYNNNSTNLSLNVEYSIMWTSSNLLSVKYFGVAFTKGAAHTIDLLYTLNIDMNMGKKIILSNYININKDFVEKILNYREPEEAMINDALEDMLTFFSVDDIIDFFNKSDSAYDSGQAIFSYFTKDSLGISIVTSHTFGDHVELELNYADIKDNINFESDVWKNCPDFLK